MEAETSSFDSSEMLATFLASTPLLAASWMLCSRSSIGSSPSSFATVDEIEGVTYVTFSGGVQPAMVGLDPTWENLVPLAADAAHDQEGLFWVFDQTNNRQNEEEGREAVMVHAGLLHLFLSMYNNPIFQNQMFDILKKGTPVVFTGHSIGGAIASLSSLWLLSYLRRCSSVSSPPSPPLLCCSSVSSTPSPPLLCITFGSPLLGNRSLSRAILQERWAGNFCHVVSKHDIVPRLLFAPLAPMTAHLRSLLEFWHFTTTSTATSSPYLINAQLLERKKSDQLFNFVLAYAEAAFARSEGAAAARSGNSSSSSFWPFGSFVFCSNAGAVCIDDGVAVVKLLYLTFAMGSPSSSVEDHLKYGDYVGNVSLQFLSRKDFMEEELSESSYEASVSMALQSAGISSHELVSGQAKECLKKAKRMGRTPNLNSAGLAIGLSKITPLRAQIEWYKASCDESDDQMGYYDSFKMRGASKRDFKVNMNRMKLGQFWDEVIRMLESNQLPHDFHKRAKWVNASQFYKLLVEPLDIAEYYRSGSHRRKGHYINHGRERRYKIFDRWWRERKVVDEEHISRRSKFASLTQDSCFWARIEEAKEWLENVRNERDSRKIRLLWEGIEQFDHYARALIDRKEVSTDVVAKNSTYSLWVQELRELKSQLQRFAPPMQDFLDGKVLP